MLCVKDTEEQVFSSTKVFTLQEVIVTHRDNAEERPVYFDMPCNYTISDVDSKYVFIETSDSEKS